jgi:hypothetical protein
VLHLTDTHISTQYAVGAAYDCSYYDLCCTDRQLVNGMPDIVADSRGVFRGAGPYGDLRGASLCDLPMRTLRNLLTNADSRDVCGYSSKISPWHADLILFVGNRIAFFVLR